MVISVDTDDNVDILHTLKYNHLSPFLYWCIPDAWFICLVVTASLIPVLMYYYTVSENLQSLKEMAAI